MYHPPKRPTPERRQFEAASAIQRIRRAIHLRIQAERALASVVLRMSAADRATCESTNGLPPGGLSDAPSFRRCFGAVEIAANL